MREAMTTRVWTAALTTRVWAAAFALGATGLGWAGPARAQWESGPSILHLLPVAATVEVGSETPGELTAGDYVSGGHRVKAYSLEGAQGAPVTIDLVSEDFDAYLHLVGPDGMELETDDDSGGACHARISTFLPADGTYRIVAASLSGDTGAFTLGVGRQQRPPATGDCGAGAYAADVLARLAAIEPTGSIAVGREIESSLGAGDAEMTDGSFVEAYRLTGEAGQVVFVDAMSRAFDTLLFAVAPDGSEYVSDDDSGGACNSRLRITLEAEPHVLVVNSLSASGAGSFTLKVSDMSGPQATGPCPGLGMDPTR